MYILVVDDEPMVQLLLLQALEYEGHNADTASNGAEALQCLATRRYDLIFTDVHMPRLNGIDLVRAVRQKDRYIPIVVMDSYPDYFTESEVGAEAFALLAKPFDLREVRRVLREVQQHLVVR
ncbi:MAG: response regulator [Fimbriimonadales bacterium]|nr:response regulator [Fimbriimonadales bacterium]